MLQFDLNRFTNAKGYEIVQNEDTKMYEIRTKHGVLKSSAGTFTSLRLATQWLYNYLLLQQPETKQQIKYDIKKAEGKVKKVGRPSVEELREERFRKQANRLAGAQKAKETKAAKAAEQSNG